MTTPDEIPDWLLAMPEYTIVRHIEGKGWCGVRQMLFSFGLFVDITPDSYGYRYCFEHLRDAALALVQWDGQGDAPGNWIKRKGLGADLLNPNFVRGYDDK